MTGKRFFKKLINKISTSKKSFVLFFVAFLFILLIPKTSYAFLQVVAGPVISAITSAVLLIIWGATSLLPQAVGAFFDIILNLNVSYTNEQFIFIGWKVVKDITNLFFVIALVAIGLATSLRIDEYHAKKTLPKLIFVAILINFSLVIAGFIIDISSIIMNYFLSDIGGIGTLFHNQSQLLFSGNWAQDLISSFTFEAPIKLALAIIMNLLMATTLFLFAILFLARYTILWFLVIISPFAFFSYILPATRTYWNQWWGAFFQWAFIGIPAAFTLYISMQLMANFDGGTSILPDTSNILGVWFPNIDRIIPLILVCVFSLIGLFITVSSNASGSQKIIGYTKKGAGMAGRGLRSYAARSGKTDWALGKISGFNKKWGNVSNKIGVKRAGDSNLMKWGKRAARTFSVGVTQPLKPVESFLLGEQVKEKGRSKQVSEKLIKKWDGNAEYAVADTIKFKTEPGALGMGTVSNLAPTMVALSKTKNALQLLKEKDPALYYKGYEQLINSRMHNDEIKGVVKHDQGVLSDDRLKDGLSKIIIKNGKDDIDVQEIIGNRIFADTETANKVTQSAIIKAAQKKVVDEIKAEDVGFVLKDNSLDNNEFKKLLAQRDFSLLREFDKQKPGYIMELQDAITGLAKTPQEFENAIKKLGGINASIVRAPYTPNGKLTAKEWSFGKKTYTEEEIKGLIREGREERAENLKSIREATKAMEDKKQEKPASVGDITRSFKDKNIERAYDDTGKNIKRAYDDTSRNIRETKK